MEGTTMTTTTTTKTSDTAHPGREAAARRNARDLAESGVGGTRMFEEEEAQAEAEARANAQAAADARPPLERLYADK